MLAEKFERKAPQPKGKAKADDQAGRKKQSTALSGARVQDLGMVLSYLKLDPVQVRNALLSCDAKRLPHDSLRNLLQAVPLEHEVKWLNREKQDTPGIEWGKVQTFVHMMGTQVPDMGERVKLWLYTYEFRHSYEQVTRDIEAFSRALDVLLRTDTAFCKLLALIVRIGNTLNQGTRHTALGFKMESLGCLGALKATDGTSLLDFLVVHVTERDPELLSFDKELLPVAAARSLKLRDIAHGIQGLKSGMDLIRRRLRSPVQLPDGVDCADAMSAMLHNFKEEHEEEVAAVCSKLEQAQTSARQLAQHFGEDTASFAHITAFQQQFEAAVKAKQQKEEREKRKKTLKMTMGMLEKMQQRCRAVEGDSESDFDDGPPPPQPVASNRKTAGQPGSDVPQSCCSEKLESCCSEKLES